MKSNNKVDENIIATTKIQNNYGAIQFIAILDFSPLLLVKLSLHPFWYQFFAFFFLWQFAIFRILMVAIIFSPSVIVIILCN